MSQTIISYVLDIAPESEWITVTPSNLARSTFFYVQEAGDFIAGEKYYTRRSQLDSYLLKYTLSGKGLLEYGGRTYELTPGSFFWIDCRSEQYYRTGDEGGWHVLWTHFYGASSAAYYDRFLELNEGKCVSHLPAQFSMEHELRRIIEYYRIGKAGVEADVKSSELLVRLMTSAMLSALTGATGESAPECIRQAAAYISAGYSERITLDGLARRFNMNKYYFQKLFKKHMGYTPNEYLITARINRGKEFLRTTDMTVGEVAAAVGVENVSHFISLFKRHEGITPNAYRLHWRSEGGE